MVPLIWNSPFWFCNWNILIGRARLTPCLLTVWFPVSSGHQQPRYSICTVHGVSVFRKEGFLLPKRSQCWWVIKMHINFISSKIIITFGCVLYYGTSGFYQYRSGLLNTLRPRQNGHHFPCIFLDENVWIVVKISLKFDSKGPINNIPALVQTMAWRPPGGKPLSVTAKITGLRMTKQKSDQ